MIAMETSKSLINFRQGARVGIIALMLLSPPPTPPYPLSGLNRVNVVFHM